ncbi:MULTISPECIES: TetR/AcrR family transcriptional regulator [Agrobacterium]|uniref:TetR/AcrR family transcriptional regulator n=2 Tax=Agrobacterium TaxID=357 RepID=UPI001F39CA8E|nr:MULTISPECIES: TetR/AcrR family transcriptional regulator [Agrobacterium]
MMNQSIVKRIYHASGDTRLHILKTASQLFYTKGFRAVGVDEIIREANIARATLYRHFNGKDELITAYLSERERVFIAQMQEIPLDLAQSPAEKIFTIFEQLRSKQNSPEFRGCAFFLALSEYSDFEPVRTIAFRYKEFVRDFFADVLGPDVQPSLADQLAMIYEGALATLVVRPATSVTDNAIACVKALLLVHKLYGNE